MNKKKAVIEETDIILSSDSYRDRMKGFILIKDENTGQKFFIWDERVKDYYLNNCRAGMKLRLRCMEDEGHWHVVKITIMNNRLEEYKSLDKSRDERLITDDKEPQVPIVSYSNNSERNIVTELDKLNKNIEKLIIVLEDILRLYINRQR